MRYTISQYAEALADLLESSDAKKHKHIAERLITILMHQHAASLLPRILEHTERLMLLRRGLKKVVVEGAAPLTHDVKEEITRLLGRNISLEESIVPDLIGGIRITIDDEVIIDASAKKQMEKMFSGTAK